MSPTGRECRGHINLVLIPLYIVSGGVGTSVSIDVTLSCLCDIHESVNGFSPNLHRCIIRTRCELIRFGDLYLIFIAGLKLANISSNALELQRQTIHMKYQALLSLKDKSKYSIMSSAVFVISVLRVLTHILIHLDQHSIVFILFIYYFYSLPYLTLAMLNDCHAHF